MKVARDVADERPPRSESRRIGDVGRIALLGRPEVRCREILVDDGADDLRTVDGQDVRRSNPVDVHVADAPAAANDRLLCWCEGKTKTWTQVVAIGIDERTVGYRAVLRADHRN